MDLSKSLRKACAEAGLKNVDVRQAGVGAGTISRISVNDPGDIGIKTIEKIAKFFGMKVSEFIALGE